METKKLNLKVTRIDNGFILAGDRTLCATDIDSAAAIVGRVETVVPRSVPGIALFQIRYDI